jgi:hypothetical protein
MIRVVVLAVKYQPSTFNRQLSTVKKLIRTKDMLERDNQDSKESIITHNPLEDVDLTNFWWHGGSYWSPFVKQEIFDDLNQTNVEEEERKKKFDSNLKVVCLFLSTLCLLGFGISTQSNSIANTLRYIANNPVQQTTSINNR